MKLRISLAGLICGLIALAASEPDTSNRERGTFAPGLPVKERIARQGQTVVVAQDSPADSNLGRPAAAGTAAPLPAFEVASIRPPGSGSTPQVPSAAPMFIGLLNGGPGTPSPEPVAGTSVSLKFAIQRAYGVKPFQVDAPDSIDSRWEIEATVRAGATAEDLKLMLQNLLQDRFHRKVHHEARIFSAYTLVLAKGGLEAQILHRHWQPVQANRNCGGFGHEQGDPEAAAPHRRKAAARSFAAGSRG